MIEVKKDIEWTIWSIVHVSMTQLDALKASLLTVLAKKMECSRVEVKGKLEWIPDMRAKWDVVGLTYGCVEIATISGTTLETPSTPVAMQEVHTFAAWWASPRSVPEVRKANNCSHCA